MTLSVLAKSHANPTLSLRVGGAAVAAVAVAAVAAVAAAVAAVVVRGEAGKTELPLKYRRRDCRRRDWDCRRRDCRCCCCGGCCCCTSGGGTCDCLGRIRGGRCAGLALGKMVWWPWLSMK